MSDNTYSGELSRKGYVIFAIILCTLIGLIVARPAVQAAAGLEPGHHELLLANEDYHDGEETVLRAQLIQRIETQPFNLVALGLFVCAIVHTFFTHRFTAAAHRIEEDHKRRLSDLHEEGARFQVDKRLESDMPYSIYNLKSNRANSSCLNMVMADWKFLARIILLNNSSGNASPVR